MSTSRAEGYEPRITLGDKFRRIRRDQHLTQKAFAELLGYEEKAYGAWESGINVPGGEKVLEIARRVGYLYGDSARDWLLGIERASPPEPPTPGPGESTPITSKADRIARLAASKTRGRSTAGYPTPAVAA